MTGARLFASDALYGRELQADEVPQLQALFDANPEYFVAINGRRANADEAQVEFDEMPPAHLGFTRRWFAGLFDATSSELVGVSIVVSDLAAPGVWHIALFLLATKLHGRGLAGPVFDAIEAWARRSGALWLRLGVVRGNARAEAFWARQGFQEVRVRGIDTGGPLNTVRVLIKPLREHDVQAYLALVPRDRPGSTLP